MKTITLIGKACAILCLSLLFAGCSSESREDEPAEEVRPTEIINALYIKVLDSEGNNLLVKDDSRKYVEAFVTEKMIDESFVSENAYSYSHYSSYNVDKNPIIIASRWIKNSDDTWTKKDVEYTPKSEYAERLGVGYVNLSVDSSPLVADFIQIIDDERILAYNFGITVKDEENTQGASPNVIPIMPISVKTLVTWRMSDGTEETDVLTPVFKEINRSFCIDKLYINDELVWSFNRQLGSDSSQDVTVTLVK